MNRINWTLLLALALAAIAVFTTDLVSPATTLALALAGVTLALVGRDGDG